VCESLGLNLAIIKTDADMADINTAVILSKLHLQTSDVDKNKFYIGLTRENASVDWTWYTGEALDVAWPYWQAGQPDSTKDNMCARILLWKYLWLNARDSSCFYGYPIILCE